MLCCATGSMRVAYNQGAMPWALIAACSSSSLAGALPLQQLKRPRLLGAYVWLGAPRSVNHKKTRVPAPMPSAPGWLPSARPHVICCWLLSCKQQSTQYDWACSVSMLACMNAKATLQQCVADLGCVPTLPVPCRLLSLVWQVLEHRKCAPPACTAGCQGKRDKV